MRDVNELDVVGVRVELPANQPIVLLKEVDGDRYLPIWIGAVEATAIAFAQQGVVPPRPMTHDLIRDLLEALGQDAAARCAITDLRDGVFYAELVFDGGIEVSARPSDAIALALRTGARSSGPRRSSTRPASRSRTSRRTRSRSSASSSTRSRPEDFETAGGRAGRARPPEPDATST